MTIIIVCALFSLVFILRNVKCNVIIDVADIIRACTEMKQRSDRRKADI